MATTTMKDADHVRFMSLDNLIHSIENLYFACVTVIIICLTSSLPFSKLCIGILYINQCPAQTQIPAWLIVSGCRSLISIILIFFIIIYVNTMDHCCKKTPPAFVGLGISFLIIISFLFHFIWSIVGVVWSSARKSMIQHEDPNEITTYCHSTPYAFQMGIALFHLIIIIMSLIIGGIYTCCRRSSKSSYAIDKATYVIKQLE
ncbi:unnamed protein product [Adineta steineri]|uniref:Uncharacterized protein n=2 Tax=Adineta steineri TaxID=433720 RepID=A0A819KSK0_9BILA|nr:unnamed protein product [Adineta steineri]